MFVRSLLDVKTEFCFPVLDGSLLYERIPNKPEVERIPLTPPQAAPAMQAQQTILKRTRPPFEETNGSDGECATTFVNV